jgi:citrate synthase
MAIRNRNILAISAVVGIAIIVIAVLYIQNTIPKAEELDNTEDRILIDSTKSLDEVKLFLEIYPNAVVEVDSSRSTVDDVAVKYSFQKNYEERNTSQTIKMYVVLPEANDDTERHSVRVQCVTSSLDETGSGMTAEPSSENIMAYLQETECAK